MIIGVDSDVCKKVKCKYRDIAEGKLCTLTVGRKNQMRNMFAGNGSPLPQDCPYKTLHVIEGKEVNIEGYAKEWWM